MKTTLDPPFLKHSFGECLRVFFFFPTLCHSTPPTRAIPVLLSGRVCVLPPKRKK